MAVIRPIRNEEDHAAALRRIEELWHAPDGSEEADELEVLATLVDVYEDTHWPIETPDAVDVLRYVMTQRDLSPSDLVPYIGQRGHVYDVLNRRRRLSLSMIQRLHKELGIPSDLLLVQPVQLVPEAVESTADGRESRQALHRSFGRRRGGQPMTKYKEFDTINEIDRARNDLTSKLQLMFCYHDWRRINRDEGDTYFLHPSGEKVLWWAPRPFTSPSNGRLRFDNRFGYGMPGARDPMNAEAEINFPSDEPRNDLAGVFLRNLKTNSVVLAHRGIATRGKRIPIDQLIAEWQKNNGPTILAHDIINPLIVRPLLLIGDINSPLLKDKIVAFVRSYCETKDHCEKSRQFTGTPT